MKSFSRFREDADVAEAHNVFLFEAKDQLAAIVAEFLCEGGRTYDLGKGYYCRFDRAHVTGQQDHLHVYLKKQQACVINRDGTPSHSTTVELPGHVRDSIKALGLVTLDESMEFLLGPTLADNMGAEALRQLLEDAEVLRTSPGSSAA